MENNTNAMVSPMSLLSDVLYDRTGHRVATPNIHPDRGGWYFYIPAGCIEPGRPLFLSHYRGVFMVVMAEMDYGALERGEMDPAQYVDGSVWNFGYFWGGGTLLNGVYWQPFWPHSTGIQDKVLVQRYLSILHCRTGLNSHGYPASAEQCAACHVEACPVARHKAKTRWEDEIHERDDRHLLYSAAAHRLQAAGLKARSCCGHYGNSVLLHPGYAEDTVEVYFPHKVMVNLLYHPGERNINELLDALPIEAGVPWYITDAQRPIDGYADRDDILAFWRDHCNIKWLHQDETPEVPIAAPEQRRMSAPSPASRGFFQRLLRRSVVRK